MNKAYIDFTSDSTMLAVVDYYEHHGSANDKMLAYYILLLSDKNSMSYFWLCNSF